MDKTGLLTLVGKNIRTIRLERKMTIEKTAELLQITPGYLGLMERGQRGISAKFVHKFSEIFNVPIDRFFPQGEVQQPDSPREILKKQIAFSIKDFNEKELEFVMQLVLNFKVLNRSQH